MSALDFVKYLIVFLILLLSAQTASQARDADKAGKTSVVAVPAAPPTRSPVVPEDASADQPLPAPEYVLQRGDNINIKVFNRPELNESVVIRPDGRVTVMLLDEIEAAGLTPARLDALITERYATYFKDPQVSIIVTSFTNQKVFVGGEVLRPGLLKMEGNLTLLGALFQAGGPIGTARLDSVVLLRDSGQGHPVATKIDVKNLLKAQGEDIELMPFDVVYVPMSKIAKVDKWVDQYIRQLIPVSLTAGFTYLAGDATAVHFSN